MGLDFLSIAAPAFHKGIDKDRIDLALPDLFRQPMRECARSYMAKLSPNHTVEVGEELRIASRDSRLCLLRMNTVVATFTKPPDELTNAVEQCYGEGAAMVAVKYSLTRTIEINLC